MRFQRKGRRIALLGALAATGMAAFFAYQSRAYWIESWHLYRFDGLDAEGKRRAIEALGVYGGERAARKLAGLAAGSPHGEAALAALPSVLPRVSRRLRTRVTEDLIELAAGDSDDASDTLEAGLVRIGKRAPDLLGLFAERLDGDSGTLRWVAACVVAQSWATRRAAVEEVVAGLSLDGLIGLLYPCVRPRPGDAVPDPPFEAGREIAAWLGAGHGTAEVRALALTFRVIARPRGPKVVAVSSPYDFAPLARAWTGDPSPLVRKAALRIAGFVGHHAGVLDLTGIVLTEEDPELLAEAVQARSLWASGPPSARDGFELWDGFACDWIPASGGKERVKSWAPGEIERLRAVLESERAPRLRDACSHALAGRYRGMLDDPESVPEPLRSPGLELHEWGVWREGDGVLRPPEELIAGLPGFVHRSEVSAARILGRRYLPRTAVFKPVVFFRAPEALSLLVRVGFQGGRPWCYFPAATDYSAQLGFAVRPGKLIRGQGSTPTASDASSGPPASPLGPQASDLVAIDGPPEATEGRQKLEDRKNLAPPWLSEPEGPSPHVYLSPGPGLYPDPDSTSNPRTFRSFYETVPWLVPNHPRVKMGGRTGARLWTGLGLEWCGLRVGYPPDVEGSAPEVAPASWWARLREVPCADVAARGERERFLFYDGAVDMPGPVRVSWSDESRRALLLRARSFEAFPEDPLLEDRWWLSDIQKSRARTTVPIPAAFVISRDDGAAARGTVLEELRPAGDPVRLPLEGLELTEDELERRLGAVLEREGLTPEESRSLLATWREDFFRAPGLRVITVLPQWVYDAMLPLEVYPLPEELVRVGLVWKECEELEVGTASWGLLSEDERWSGVPWRMPYEDIDLPRDPNVPGEPYPLRTGPEGVILGPGRPGSPDLSADGRFLSWQVVDGSTVRVLRADLERETVLEVASFGNVASKYGGGTSISSDGSRVAFRVRLAEWGRVAFLADLEEEVRYVLPTDSRPEISDDGTKVLYEAHGKGSPARETLMLLDLESGRTRTLFQGDRERGIGIRDLSGDGRSVAFTLQRGRAGEVYHINLVEETILNVSRWPGLDRCPSISRDGRRIAFTTERLRNLDVALVDLERRRLRTVTRRPGADHSPFLSADGRTLVYRSQEAGRFTRLDLETGARRAVEGTEGAWHVEAAQDGSRLAFIRGRENAACLVVLPLPDAK